MRAIEELEAVVRAAVGQALRTSLVDWPREKSLQDVPDAMFDSLAKLETISVLEQELRTGPLSLDNSASAFDSIAAITEWVLTETGDRT